MYRYGTYSAIIRLMSSVYAHVNEKLVTGVESSVSADATVPKAAKVFLAHLNVGTFNVIDKQFL